MLNTRLQCLLVMLMLSVIGFGPLSLTCLIGFYVVLARPVWFRLVTRRLYRGVSVPDAAAANRLASPAAVRLETLLVLVILLILDIAPVPVTGAIGLYVVLFRPAWFAARVAAIYASGQ